MIAPCPQNRGGQTVTILDLLDEWLFACSTFAYATASTRRVIINTFDLLVTDAPQHELQMEDTIAHVLQDEAMQGDPRPEVTKALASLARFLSRRLREERVESGRLELFFDPRLTSWSMVHDLLEQSAAGHSASLVARHMVGASLQLRFPDITVSNVHSGAADVQAGRLGDFELGDTAFHVTMSPFEGVFDKCRRNVEAGFRVYLVVPDGKLLGARQNAENVLPDRIAVESIESFIANNIEELSVFSTTELVSGFRRLLDLYNERVAAVDSDRSLLIDIPATLK